MLSALLTSIQSSLTGSKSFVIGSLLPLLLFVFTSGAMLYAVSAAFRSWLSSPEAAQLTTVTAATLAVAGLAYVFSALSTTLLETLEGKHPPLSWFAVPLHDRQWQKLQKLDKKYKEYVRQLVAIDRRTTEESLPPPLWVRPWPDLLEAARSTGVATKTCVKYPCSMLGRSWDLISNRWGMRQLRKILTKRKHGSIVTYEDLDAAVQKMEGVLKQNSTDLNTNASRRLMQDYEDLVDAMYYARDKYDFESTRIYNLTQFSFPGKMGGLEERSSLNILAPTAMGNIGRTMRSYAVTRYKLDLDVFWTRLQKTLQGSKDFYGVLQDMKIQLDCMVALCWLTGLFTVVWGTVLPLVSSSYITFLAIGIGGPLLTYGWYLLATHRYRIFADLVRSSVDLYRFDLLKDLHTPPPYVIEE
jgi:hypothetical protein